jgi:hypothetical protein
MKKSYVYFAIPLATLVIFFFAFYMGAHRDFKNRADAKVKASEDAKQAKLKKEAQDREIAVKSAVELQEKRRKEKKERDEREALAKEEREKARQAREKAGRDSQKFKETVARLKKEIEVEKTQIAEVQVERKRVTEEQAFLRDYVKKAEANQRSLMGVIERIEAADRAAEAAAKAAAAAAAAAKK